MTPQRVEVPMFTVVFFLSKPSLSRLSRLVRVSLREAKALRSHALSGRSDQKMNVMRMKNHVAHGTQLLSEKRFVNMKDVKARVHESGFFILGKPQATLGSYQDLAVLNHQTDNP